MICCSNCEQILKENQKTINRGNFYVQAIARFVLSHFYSYVL